MKLSLSVAGREISIHAEAGRTLADLIREAGIPLNMACGGRGICGRCLVTLVAGRYGRGDGESREIGPEDGRLEIQACEWNPLSDGCRIEIPTSSLIEAQAQVHEDFVLGDLTLAPRTRRVVVESPAACLGRTRSRVERFTAALESAGIGPVEWPISVVRALSALPGGDTERIGVTIGPRLDEWVVCRISSAEDATHLGLAVDIGTTTVVCALIDMDSGRLIGRVSGYNQQIRQADDVASRISVAAKPSGLAELRRLVVDATLNPLIREVCRGAGYRPEDVTRMAVAGNTVMMHLLLGLSPVTIGVLPFEPAARRFTVMVAADLGVEIAAAAGVDIVPSVAGYLGGDVVADMAASHLVERTPPVLLVDIGTNGEMVLWDGKRLTGAATAAGPAFEGAGVRHGCRAARGAIDHIRWRDGGRLEFTVIGGGKPTGLCGSAMIDFVAGAAAHDWLGVTGRFNMDRIKAEGRADRIETARGVEQACVIADAGASGRPGPILVTERDIAEILKAKAAVRAGMETVLRFCSLAMTDLSEVVLAGGFAHHLDLDSAIRIGLLPDLPTDRFHVMGNGSLAGAYLALQWPGAAGAFDELGRRVRMIELNQQPSFSDAYIDAMMLDRTPGATEARS